MHGTSLMFSALEMQMDNCKLHYVKLRKKPRGRKEILQAAGIK